MRQSRAIHIGAAVIVGCAVVLAFTSSLNDSPIVDEVPHIGAGFSYVTQLDERLNPEHPPFIKDLAGLALLPLGLSHTVFQTPSWTTEVNGQWQFGHNVIFESGGNPDTIVQMARLPMLLIFIFACWLMWKWARERYSDTAALIALILFSFSPTILAHMRLVTTDMGAAVGVLAATYCFLRFLRKPARASFVWAALSLGLALLAKFNTALLGPFFVLVAVLYGLDGHLDKKAWKRAARMFGITALMGAASFVCVVWPFYFVQTFNQPAQQQLAETKAITAGYPNSILKSMVIWGADKPVIRAATHWELGLLMVAQRAEGGNTIYWLGRVVNAGGPGYFPLIYFMKEPLAWWILVALAVGALVFHHRKRRTEHAHGHFFTDNFDEWVWLLWLAIYWAVSINSTLNIGVRHLLPTYPFAILLVSGRLSVMLDWLRAHDRMRLRIFSAVIAVLLGWYAFESVRVWPSYLAYFNQFVGGPSGGHNFVADSNLDWGQDLKRLGQWVEQNDIQKISLDYFGWADPGYYLKNHSIYTTTGYWKDARDFITRNRSNGWIAVSATYFQQAVYSTNQDNGGYRWLLNYDPVTVIGHSIFVWHVTK
jgi:4-amino-4-deoxy-L-arabinose transferase-like glycosyltransferase